MPTELDTAKTIALNIQLSEVDKEMLERLKKDSGKSFGAILRGSISTMYRMRFANEPRCANSEACKCPQMHQIKSAETQSDADLLLSHPAPDATA